jgi:hypothetical protein
METRPTLTLSLSEEPLRYELRDARELRGWLVTQTLPPQLSTESGTAWDLAVYRRRLSWYAVAVQRNSDRADVAYYPHWTPGGTIAFEEQRYQLRQRLLTNMWRLQDEDRHTLAVMRPRQPRRKEGKLRLPELAIDLDGATEEASATVAQQRAIA